MTDRIYCEDCVYRAIEARLGDVCVEPNVVKWYADFLQSYVRRVPIVRCEEARTMTRPCDGMARYFKPRPRDTTPHRY